MEFKFFRNNRKAATQEEKIEEQTRHYFEMINGYTPVFSTFEGGIYEMALTRRAIDCIATHCAKLLPEVTGSNNEAFERVLQNRPNPNMNTFQYLYKLATYLETDNTAFVMPIYDASYTRPVGFYPVRPLYVQYLTYNSNDYFKFTFPNGTYTLPKNEIGIMNKFTLRSDFFGASNDVLDPTLELINTANQGIIEGVKNSASIRFLAKLAHKLNEKDELAARKRLTEQNLSADNNGGVFVYDVDFDEVKQVTSEPFNVNAAQMKTIEDNVFTYFGVSKGILQNNFKPEEWLAFYEGKIEPFAIQASLVHTNMKFTTKELAFDNSIIFTANRLQYESNGTKLNVVTSLFDRGMLTQNMGADVFQLPHVPGGDRYFIRKEYVDMTELKDGMATQTDTEGADNGNNK